MTEDHDHEDYEVASGLKCDICGEGETVCAMCGISLHKCAQRLPSKFRRIPSFPDYMVNKQCTVKNIETNRLCVLVRVTENGYAMINIWKDGKKHTMAAQNLRDEAFGEQVPSH